MQCADCCKLEKWIKYLCKYLCNEVKLDYEYVWYVCGLELYAAVTKSLTDGTQINIGELS